MPELRKVHNKTVAPKAGAKGKNKPLSGENILQGADLWRALLTRGLRAKHPLVWEHSQRVAGLSNFVLGELELSGRKTGISSFAIMEQALLHDIGKLSLSKKLMAKKGLSESERKKFAAHPQVGHALASVLPAYYREVILAHHERLDGSGYPKGLAKKQLALSSKIIAVVDSYDAMISKRGYNVPKTPKQAIEELVRNAGKKYDAGVVNALADVLKRSGKLEQ